MGTWSKGAFEKDLASRIGLNIPNEVPKELLINSVNRTPVARELHTPKSAEQRNSEQFQSADVIGNIVRNMGNFNQDPDPQYDWAKKAEGLSSQIARLQGSLAAQRAKNAHIRTLNSHISNGGGGGLANLAQQLGGAGGGGGRFAAFMRAISGQESGGNYGAVNSSSGALGKYQIMPGNFVGAGGWDKEALGRDITAQQFLHSPKLQEAIARHKLHNYYSRYGVRGAASAWYSGDPNKWRNNSPQGGYPSIAAYVASIIRRMHGG